MHRPDVADRFWSKVAKKESGCWEWTAAKDRDGYGWFKYNGRQVYAHRLSLEFHTHESVEGLQACHRCDNPSCVRPEHLFLGTQGDNSADMVAKNRQAKGSRHGTWTRPDSRLRGERNKGGGKLTSSQVLEIRRRYSTGKERQVDLAAEFGVTQALISSVIRGASWAHLPGGRNELISK